MNPEEIHFRAWMAKVDGECIRRTGRWARDLVRRDDHVGFRWLFGTGASHVEAALTAIRKRDVIWDTEQGVAA